MTSMAALDERQLLVEGIKEKGTESRADLKYVPEGKFQKRPNQHHNKSKTHGQTHRHFNSSV